MKVTLSEVLITHVQPGGSTSDARVMEHVGMSYG